MLLFFASSPLVYVAMFIAMTPQLSAKERWDLSRKACHISLLILLLVWVLGDFILKFLGVSLGAFRVAGGIIMGMVGLDMVRNNLQTGREKLSNGDVIVPLAFPMISGPGAISALMLAQSSAHTINDKWGILGAIFLIMGVFYALFYLAALSSKFISHNAVVLIYKVSGITVVLIAVEFILKGIKSIC